MTVEAVKEFGLSRKDASRAKNMFALGLLSWLYGRPTEGTLNFLSTKFANKPAIRDANITAFKTGYAFGETTEVFAVTYEVAAGPDAGRHLPADLRQPRPGVRADHRAPARPACRCSSAPTRSRRPRTCCTS